MVSYIASPAVTRPPGELIYRLIGSSGFSDSKKSNWAQIKDAVWSSIGPVKK